MISDYFGDHNRGSSSTLAGSKEQQNRRNFPHRQKTAVPLTSGSSSVSKISLRPSSLQFTNSYWRRSRFSWFLVFACLILLYLLYQMYGEHLRQLRFQNYIGRVSYEYIFHWHCDLGQLFIFLGSLLIIRFDFDF